jgi:hypothetical protein
MTVGIIATHGIIESHLSTICDSCSWYHCDSDDATMMHDGYDWIYQSYMTVMIAFIAFLGDTWSSELIEFIAFLGEFIAEFIEFIALSLSPFWAIRGRWLNPTGSRSDANAYMYVYIYIYICMYVCVCVCVCVQVRAGGVQRHGTGAGRRDRLWDQEVRIIRYNYKIYTYITLYHIPLSLARAWDDVIGLEIRKWGLWDIDDVIM